MSEQRHNSKTKESQLGKHVAELRVSLASRDPKVMALSTGSHFEDLDSDTGLFRLAILGQETKINYPGFVAVDAENNHVLPVSIQALIAYYFSIANGKPVTGKWISFSELPDGRFYTRAFQGYTGNELFRSYGENIDDLTRAAQNLPLIDTAFWGEPIGQRSFGIQALPRVPLLLVFWQGDEDFPSRYQLLFDGSVSNYLNTDVCAILGSMMTHKLISNYPTGSNDT